MKLGDGDRGFSPREEEERARERHFRKVLEARDQLVGLLESTLLDADLGEQGGGMDATSAQCPGLDRLEGREQGLLGLVPLALRDLVFGVAHHAERKERGVLATLEVIVEDVEPLLETRGVGGHRARFHHAAEDIPEDSRVVALSTGGGGHRGIEGRHPSLDAAKPHIADAERRESVDLELPVAEGSSDVEGGFGLSFRCSRVGGSLSFGQ